MSVLPERPLGVLDIDASTQQRIEANLRLAQRFFDMVFDDPSIADGIRANASVVFLPADDADLARRNAAAGERMRAAGRTVHFVRV